VAFYLGSFYLLGLYKTDDGISQASPPTPIRTSKANGADASIGDEGRKRQKSEVSSYAAGNSIWERPHRGNNDITWLTGPSGHSLVEQPPSEYRPARRPEKITSLGMISVKRERSKYLGHGDRMAMIDKVGFLPSFFLIMRADKPSSTTLSLSSYMASRIRICVH